MPHILIVEDDRNIAELLQMYLEKEGYAVTVANDGGQGLAKYRAIKPDLVLLDVMMPVMDGITCLSKLRENYNLPVILLTAKSEDTDKILGLNIGADDYITKPFNPIEVAARVKSQIRRYTQLGAAVVKPKTLCVGGIELDDNSKTVTRDGMQISLTPTEYEILKLLMQNLGRVYSPKEIYREIWRENPMTAENTIAVHIRHLREKLEINPAEPRYLKAVWGHGYMMEGDKR